ncbi:MAG TPA: hypothetical protein DCY20_01575, partial [Firmicutes bacterium]|nr:hypothetical protein [Bacillota bacterium]
MKKNLKRSFFVFIGGILLFTFSITINSIQSHQREPIKVGFYEYRPHYYLDNHSNPKGFYHDILEILADNLNFTYEYVPVTPSESLNSLH